MPASRSSSSVGIDRRPGLGEHVQCGGRRRLDDRHLAQRGQLVEQFLDHQSRAPRSRRTPALRLSPQAPSAPAPATGLVDRNGDRTDREDGVVEDDPLITGSRQDRHAVAGLDALGDQTQCGRTNLVRSLLARDVRPCAVDQALENHVVGIVAFVAEYGTDDVVVLTDGEGCGNTVLTHDLGLSTATRGFAVPSLVGHPRPVGPHM